MAQLVEHILGKDEVPSSNLGSSSKQPRSSKEPRGFGFLWALYTLFLRFPTWVVWSCYSRLVPGFADKYSTDFNAPLRQRNRFVPFALLRKEGEYLGLQAGTSTVSACKTTPKLKRASGLWLFIGSLHPPFRVFYGMELSLWIYQISSLSTGHIDFPTPKNLFILQQASFTTCFPHLVMLTAPIAASAPIVRITHVLCFFRSVFLKNINFRSFSHFLYLFTQSIKYL